MTTLLYGFLAEAGPPADDEVTRRQADPIDLDKQPAEAQGAPDYNEVETDPDTNLGFASRQVASDWHHMEQSAPFWADAVAHNHEHNDMIDRQVSTAGNAAKLEAQGVFGHGTMGYAVGIEPTIREGAAFGADYFAVDNDGIQPNVSYDTGVQPDAALDGSAIARAGAAYREQSRDASVPSLYETFYKGVIG